jgi:hypothetical protein
MYRIPIYKKYRRESENFLPTNWYDFVTNCKIRTGGKIDYFKPYDYQVKLISLMTDYNLVICKSRQLGISELICSYFLFNAVTNPGYLGLIVSKSQRDSSLLARRIKRMIEGNYFIKTKTDNIGDIEIEGGGRILFGNSNPEFYRGIESVNHVFMDEFAFIENVIEIRNAIKPAQLMVGDSAREFIVSTPNGKNEFFRLLNSGNIKINLLAEIDKVISTGNYSYWLDDDGWCKFLISWKSHPIYGLKKDFLHQIKAAQKLTEEIVNQEYNLSFLDGIKSYFNFQLIQKTAVLKSKLDFEENIDYYFGIDSSNFGGDFTVCMILKKDCEGFKMIDFYRKNNQSSEYHLSKISDLILKFKPKNVSIETTGGTGQVWLESLSLEHFSTKFKAVKTNEESKRYMLNRLKYLLENNQLLMLQDRILTDEFLNFGSDLKAYSGKNDDLIMATSFAILGA